MVEMEQDEDMVQIEARMKMPLEWKTSAKCKIQDLQEPQYEEALRLIKRHYFSQEPMCKSSALLEDETSVDTYIEMLRSRMKDTTSLVALSLTSERIIGVAVARINSYSEKSDTYNRVQVLEGEAINKIMHLKNAVIERTKAYEKFGYDKYFRIFILSVHPSYQLKGIDAALLNACTDLAASLKLSAVGGIFTSGINQSVAENVGFQLLAEIRYGQWIVDDEIVFNDPGKGNYSAGFMGMLVPTEENMEKDDTSNAF